MGQNSFLYACSKTGLIIDSNLLILLIIGLHNESDITNHERTGSYCVDDFRFLKKVLSTTNKIILTPHIMSEVSNMLIEGKSSKSGSLINNPHFDESIKIVSNADEVYIKKEYLIENLKELASVGFTDLSIIKAAKQLGCAVMTDDGRLMPWLEHHKCTATNLTRIRTYYLLNQDN